MSGSSHHTSRDRPRPRVRSTHENATASSSSTVSGVPGEGLSYENVHRARGHPTARRYSDERSQSPPTPHRRSSTSLQTSSSSGSLSSKIPRPPRVDNRGWRNPNPSQDQSQRPSSSRPSTSTSSAPRRFPEQRDYRHERSDSRTGPQLSSRHVGTHRERNVDRLGARSRSRERAALRNTSASDARKLVMSNLRISSPPRPSAPSAAGGAGVSTAPMSAKAKGKQKATGPIITEDEEVTGLSSEDTDDAELQRGIHASLRNTSRPNEPSGSRSAPSFPLPAPSFRARPSAQSANPPVKVINMPPRVEAEPLEKMRMRNTRTAVLPPGTLKSDIVRLSAHRYPHSLLRPTDRHQSKKPAQSNLPSSLPILKQEWLPPPHERAKLKHDRHRTIEEQEKRLVAQLEEAKEMGLPFQGRPAEGEHKIRIRDLLTNAPLSQWDPEQQESIPLSEDEDVDILRDHSFRSPYLHRLVRNPKGPSHRNSNPRRAELSSTATRPLRPLPKSRPPRLHADDLQPLPPTTTLPPAYTAEVVAGQAGVRPLIHHQPLPITKSLIYDKKTGKLVQPGASKPVLGGVQHFQSAPQPSLSDKVGFAHPASPPQSSPPPPPSPPLFPSYTLPSLPALREVEDDGLAEYKEDSENEVDESDHPTPPRPPPPAPAPAPVPAPHEPEDDGLAEYEDSDDEVEEVDESDQPDTPPSVPSRSSPPIAVKVEVEDDEFEVDELLNVQFEPEVESASDLYERMKIEETKRLREERAAAKKAIHRHAPPLYLTLQIPTHMITPNSVSSLPLPTSHPPSHITIEVTVNTQHRNTSPHFDNLFHSMRHFDLDRRKPRMYLACTNQERDERGLGRAYTQQVRNNAPWHAHGLYDDQRRAEFYSWTQPVTLPFLDVRFHNPLLREPHVIWRYDAHDQYGAMSEALQLDNANAWATLRAQTPDERLEWRRQLAEWEGGNGDGKGAGTAIKVEDDDDDDDDDIGGVDRQATQDADNLKLLVRNLAETGDFLICRLPQPYAEHWGDTSYGVADRNIYRALLLTSTSDAQAKEHNSHSKACKTLIGRSYPP